MSKRDENDGRLRGRELVSRRLQQAGLTVAGERGAKVANRVSEALGCGRIHLCSDPACQDCAPSRDYPIRIPSKPV
jgi:hypothetical protein